MAYLDQRDENDKQRRRAARVVVGVVFAIPILGQELVTDDFHHSVMKSGRRKGSLIFHIQWLNDEFTFEIASAAATANGNRFDCRRAGRVDGRRT